jgi:hypothetical protein
MDRITVPQPVVQRQLRICGLLLFNSASKLRPPPTPPRGETGSVSELIFYNLYKRLCYLLENKQILFEFNRAKCLVWGTRWRSLLWHCVTSRKVTGSIPDGVTGIFIDIILATALWLRG